VGKIFVSYRRDDTEYISGYIYEHLARVFGKENIFFDVDTIAGGVDYRRAIFDAIGNTAIMLVVIGPKWLAAEATPGVRRLAQPNDPVRLEIEAALQRNIPIFPLLVQQASVPGENELPPSLVQLSYQNAFAVRPGTDFPRDMERVSATIEGYVPRLTRASATPSVPTPYPVYPAPIPQPLQYPTYPTPVMPSSAPMAPAAPRSRTAPIAAVVSVALIVVLAITLFAVLPKLSSAGSTNTNGNSTSPNGNSTPTATQPPQETPPPALIAQPENYFVQCQFDAYGNYYDPAPTNVVTLDNSANSVSLDWATSITDNDPAGKVWASTSPPSGTVTAGRQAQFTVIPGPTFCHDLQATHLGTFHVKVTYHITGQSILAADTITAQAN
jgi:hypothetical protein